MKKNIALQESVSRLQKSEWFGSDYSFSSKFRYKYEYNKFEKDLSSRKLLDVHKSLLIKQQDFASSQLSLCRVLSSKVDIVSDQVREVNSFIREKEYELYVMSRAATLIQKYIRGYLTRKNIEEFIISRKREKLSDELDGILDQRRFYLYNIGRLPKISVRMIQRAYRRHKFREKIDRLWIAYNNYLLTKEEANFMRLKRRIKELVCRNIVKNLKFRTMKARRLKEIREKRAIIIIKSSLKKLKIRPKLLIERIKKYKRMQRSILKRKKKKLQEMIENFEGDPNEFLTNPKFQLDNISVDSQEELGTTTSDRDAMEREKMLKRMENERKVRISLGMISYNCKEVKIKRMNTLLDDKAVPESVSVSGRELPALTRSPRKFKPKFSPRARNWMEDPNYLNTTLSFQNRLKKIKDKKKFDLSKVGKIPLNLANLLTPTKSSLLKVKMRSLSTGKPEGENRFHAKRGSEVLVESVDNEVKLKRVSVKLSPL